MSNTHDEQEAISPGPQFGLKHLLLFIAYVGIAVTLFRLVGPVPGVPMLLGAAAIVIALLRRDGFIAVLGCLAIALTVLLLPALKVSNRQRRPDCFHDMKLISLALLNYEAKYGSLPPPYIADGQGRPMHSWRVLILPFMEQQSLYKRYRFDEPWDGPNNRLLHGEIVPAFHCQEDNQSPATHTSYVAVVGPGQLWDPTQVAKYSEITDGPSNTILLVERHDSGTH